MIDSFTLFAIGSVALFLGGLAGGWLITRVVHADSAPVQSAIALLITIVWVVSITAQILIPAYTVSLMLHGIMGAVVGYLFSEDGITVNIGTGD